MLLSELCLESGVPAPYRVPGLRDFYESGGGGGLGTDHDCDTLEFAQWSIVMALLIGCPVYQGLSSFFLYSIINLGKLPGPI